VRNIRFHEEARIEFLDQVAYYEEARVGLGDRFYLEVEIAVARAGRMPGLGSPYKYGTKRMYPKKFPFSIIYVVRELELVILAVAHFRRKPGYWRKRRDDA
jgi:plasmid stabilization system protein ParE